MREIVGDIWTVKSDWRVIPTNGSVNRSGLAVMGRGVALQAAKRYPDVPRRLGAFLLRHGNTLTTFAEHRLVAFPVKRLWHERAAVALISQSAAHLRFQWKAGYITGVVALPRVGCGNGRLEWGAVRPILERFLPEDNFVVVSLVGEDG